MTWTAGQKLRASTMPGFVCTSGTRPTGHSGQIIYETDTAMIAMYDGSAWRYIGATGAIAQDAEFNAAVTQSIPNAANTLVLFGTANVTSPLVTRATSGAGHSFTVNRAGRWAVSATIRWAPSAAAGERFLAINQNGGGVASNNVIGTTTTAPITTCVAATRRAVSGDVFVVNVFQASGAAANLEFANASGFCRINLSWIGP